MTAEVVKSRIRRLAGRRPADVERMHIIERTGGGGCRATKNPYSTLVRQRHSNACRARHGRYAAELEHCPQHLGTMQHRDVAEGCPPVRPTSTSEDDNVTIRKPDRRVVKARCGRSALRTWLLDVQGGRWAAEVVEGDPVKIGGWLAPVRAAKEDYLNAALTACGGTRADAAKWRLPSTNAMDRWHTPHTSLCM